MNFIKVTFHESEEFYWLNLDHVLYIKPHPDFLRPKCGYVILKDQPDAPLFISRESYHEVIELLGKKTDMGIRETS